MSDRLAQRRGTNTTVYERAEDSALLAEHAVEQIDTDDVVLDLGTGSGFVGTQIRERTGAIVIAADINPYACRRANDRGLPVVRGDLLEPFVDGTFDVVAFNPPYLPTDPDEERDDWMERALSGGPTGRSVIDPFLDAVGRVLVDGGIVLLLVSTLTNVDAVVDRAAENGFSAIALADEAYPFETITVLKLLR